MKESLIQPIRAFVVDAFYAPADLDDDASLLDTGTMDSTGVLELITFLEQRFGVEVGDREILPENFDSIRRVAAFVEKKLADPSARPAPVSAGDRA
jgi:acyl carrier protein